MIQRSPNVAKGGTWCFPGGHVERGETPRQAVIREMHEELGLVVQPMRRLGSVRILDSRHVLVVWRVQHLSGEIRPHAQEVADVRWVSLDAIATITPGLPSNASVLAML
jgi:8-oxo-dGTP diphosphatase